jgi:mannitol 2-dehydrogenase
MTALRLGLLDAVAVPVPGYDRGDLTIGIVHFGAGGFFRAHQAWYLDRLLTQGLAADWAACGVGPLISDRRMKAVMDDQSGLYTLIAKHGDGTWEPRVIGSMVEYLYLPTDMDLVLGRMVLPTTRIVSLTITEGGYGVYGADEDFDPVRFGVAADLQDGAPPATVFGCIVHALAQRWKAGQPGFTVLSCDNIQRNGDVARRVVTAAAELVSPELAQWIEETVAFPNSMVDRITPATTGADRAGLQERFGVEDGWPVVCEPFAQWVLEDSFSDGRPPLEDAGVQMVTDVGC